MKFYAAMLSLTATALMLGGAAAPLPSLAQDYGYVPYGEPMYERGSRNGTNIATIGIT